MKAPTVEKCKNIVLRTDVKNKSGLHPIALRLKINGRKFEKTLGEFCPIEYWDNKTRSVKKSFARASHINDFINKTISRVQEVFSSYKNSFRTITKDDLERELNVTNSQSFIEFVQREIEQDLKSKSISPNTIKNYNKYLSKLKGYKKNIYFNELTTSFLHNYKHHLIDKCNNATNTVNGAERFMKSFINRALKQGLIEKTPFANYKLKTTKTETVYLTKSEVEKLHKYYAELKKQHSHKKTLLLYLFCCYTGLRYSDGFAIKHKNILNNSIFLKTQKTSTDVSIPLIEPAIKLLNDSCQDIYFDKEHYANAPIFKAPTNQTTNRSLKEIATVCEINKKLSFHSSRHTFATLSISFGINPMVVKDILGHSNFKQTEHYIKIVNSDKITQMLKFDIEVE